MVPDRRDRLGIPRSERGQQRFCLTPEMIEMGARREFVGHDKFSMHFAWIRKQAARRTCGPFRVVEE
jgi:hypothetical protein